MTDTMRSGASILVESLVLQGVTTIFGYPGAAVLQIYDELFSSSVEHILVRHEQAAEIPLVHFPIHPIKTYQTSL